MVKQEAPIHTGQAVTTVVHERDSAARRSMVGLTSFCFILLQSICATVMALSGLRFLIGLGSLASASGIRFLVAFHADAIRIPMLLIAVVGSVVNLYVLWRIRSLRGRSSSQWRVAPVTQRTRRAETLQITLAVATLLLVAVESTLHLHLHGTL